MKKMTHPSLLMFNFFKEDKFQFNVDFSVTLGILIVLTSYLHTTKESNSQLNFINNSNRTKLSS